ncbi:MAG: MmgE/PrpD family protein [Candidatus Acidiferrales bacterium]
MAISSTSSGVSVSRDLAQFVAAATFEDLSQEAIADTERSVLDWLGSVMAGALEPPARAVQTVVAKLGTSTEATVFSAGRASAATAALANGVASHILELDDVHKTSTMHPGAPIIPAALAVAEREHADGKAFLLAVALGYEVALRIGEAVNPSHYRFWHPTGTAATFGAAMAAGSLLKLDSVQMLNAMGSAGTQAAGLWEFNTDGAMSKHLHPGKAAFNGVLSADLALAGFTGASRILEGERGFFRATSEGYDATRVTLGLGTKWKISENCYKLYSCCGHTHTAIDAALELRAQLCWNGKQALEEIREIRIDTYKAGYEIVKEMNPQTPYRAKFSLAYVTVAALLEGWVGLAQFTANRFDGQGVIEPNIAALLPRVLVTVSENLSAMYPKAWSSRIQLTLKDGRILSGSAEYPRGNPENPVSTSSLHDKFRSLIEPHFGVAAARSAMTAVRELVEATDMATMFCNLN